MSDYLDGLRRGVAWAASAWVALGVPSSVAATPPAWAGYAANAQHSAPAPAAAQTPARIHWRSPVDEKPVYSGDSLLIHYASPMLTASNVLVLPVKTTATGGFTLQARNAATGTLFWSLPTDYVLPSNAQWTPVLPAALGPTNTVYVAAAGGTVLRRPNAASISATATRLAFYGLDIFTAHKAEMTASVVIDTPITSDAAGTIYFGFVVQAANAARLSSGIARIAADGTGSWVSAASAAGTSSISQVAMNCAPALSPDGTTLYIAVSNGSAGYLLGLDAATLSTRYAVALTDPASGKPAWITDLSSASPTIGPDGDVYYGVVENPFGSHNGRGWLLHFGATLEVAKTPGSFGWDDTASVVPARAVGGYTGSSAYLLFTKYNDYIGVGTGTGANRIAVIDPNAPVQDAYTAKPVKTMQAVITQLGPRAASGGGVYEWCINSAVVDAASGAVFAGSEDGTLYRWDLATNTLNAHIALNVPQPEAYTPTLIGPDGTIFSINKARLYAIGK